jgi:anti-anti-sigma regulatory factor
MLRITTCNDAGNTRLVVEGKLAGASVDELEKCWRSASSMEPGSLLLDLTGVTFVDASGKKLLTLMHQQGIGFVVAGIMTRCLIKEIEEA